MRANSSIVNNHPLDEGYSEDTRSQSDGDMIYTPGEEVRIDPEILHMLLALPESKRKGKMSTLHQLGLHRYTTSLPQIHIS